MPTFFDDKELRALGLSLPAVEALRSAYNNSSSGTTVFLTLDQAVQVAIDANANAADASDLVHAIQRDLGTVQLRINDTDYSADLDKISKQLNYLQLLIAGIPDQEARFSALEKRLNNVELMANGNNIV